MNLIEAIKRKLQNLAGGVVSSVKNYFPSPTRNLISPIVPPKQISYQPSFGTRAMVALGKSPIGQGIVNLQRNIEKRTLPKVNLQPYAERIKAPVPRFGAKLAGGVAENLLNLPQRILEGGGRAGMDIRTAMSGGKLTPARLIGTGASVAEPLIDIATLGGGTVIKKTGQQALKEAGKQTLKQVIKKGALRGAGYGAAYGGLHGLTLDDEAKVGNFITNLGAGGLLGGAIGGVTSGIGGLLAMTKRTPEVEVQLRDSKGRWSKGQTPVKPKGMPKPQWEFQLKFNEKYGRNPYEPVYNEDLTKAISTEAESRVGFQARPIGGTKAISEAEEQISKSTQLPEANLPPKTAGTVPQATTPPPTLGVFQKDFDRHVQVAKLLGGADEIPTIGKLPSSTDVAKNIGMDQAEYMNQVRRAAGLPEVEVPQLPKTEALPASPAEAIRPPPPVKPPSVPSEPAGPPPEEDIVATFTKALKDFKPLRAEQEALYTKARGERLAKSLEVGKEVIGEAGFYAEKSKLGGKMPTVPGLEDLRQKIGGQEGVDKLFIRLKNSSRLSEWEKLPAREGLVKALEGKVPTTGELELLNREYGVEFTKTILSKRSFLEKLGEAGMQLYNLPRSMMAGVGDFSATLMQNMMFAYRHPFTTFKNFGKQLKMFASEKYYKASMEEIASRKNYETMKKANISFTDVSPMMKNREEQFMSSWAEKIPGFGRLVKATGRSYTGFLNRMRADVADQLINTYRNLGRDIENPRFLQSMGDLVNAGTGRGTLGKLERAAPILGQGLFSARKLAAAFKMVNPLFYIKADPFIRKEALKTMLAFLGGATLITQMAKLAGAEVSDDSTSTDYGKIKIGNTRFNMYGPYQQIAVLFSRLWNGYATSSTTGEKIMLGDESNPFAPTRWDLLTRFIASKLHPSFSLAKESLTGKDWTGQPFDLSSATLERFIPMVFSDSYALYKEHGPEGLLGTIPTILGIPAQTYGSQIPYEKTTPTGKVNIKMKPVPGLAEDIVNKFTGKEPSNIPKDEWDVSMEKYESREAELTQNALENDLKKAYEAGTKLPNTSTPKMKAELVFSEINKAQREGTLKKTTEKLKQLGLNDPETKRKLAAIVQMDKLGFTKKDRELYYYEGEARIEKILDRMDDFTKPENQAKHLKLLLQAQVIDKDQAREIAIELMKQMKAKQP